ncbi:endonuclease [Pseudoalteromonas sp. Isolate6]|uniref:endonuclease I family protein n=1 Tax=Pseudoalteromonas sp. Isolate6 TaxID=2908527 RepID=UPI001EFE73E3|nr:endonuclease [Pseudoalteromonas sp. Isolate6]MCG9760862.1 endonuclease [Pseudoalteromonas sp. Isolate6]
MFKAIPMTALLLLLQSFSSTAHIPFNYYAQAQGLTGESLKDALHKIIDNHKVLPYTDPNNQDWFDGKNMDVWEALLIADSSCPPVNPKCGEVHMLYLDETRPFTKANRGSGKHDLWDREHVWPKSRGFSKKSQAGYTDLHHLRPADRNINGLHSNYGYDIGGEIINDKLADGSEVPTSIRLDKVNESFEPSDKAKGQVARMLFYMAVRYEVNELNEYEKMPDLVLMDKNEKASQPWIGDLCTLLKWHTEFPVSNFEIERNNKVMAIQGNRNPFIDNSSWARDIWGSKCQQ